MVIRESIKLLKEISRIEEMIKRHKQALLVINPELDLDEILLKCFNEHI